MINGPKIIGKRTYNYWEMDLKLLGNGPKFIGKQTYKIIK